MAMALALLLGDTPEAEPDREQQCAPSREQCEVEPRERQATVALGLRRGVDTVLLAQLAPDFSPHARNDRRPAIALNRRALKRRLKVGDRIAAVEPSVVLVIPINLG